MGKGDRRYKDRQVCSDTEMTIRWKLAFEKLDAVDRRRLEAKLEQWGKVS